MAVASVTTAGGGGFGLGRGQVACIGVISAGTTSALGHLGLEIVEFLISALLAGAPGVRPRPPLRF